MHSDVCSISTNVTAYFHLPLFDGYLLTNCHKIVTFNPISSNVVWKKWFITEPPRNVNQTHSHTHYVTLDSFQAFHLSTDTKTYVHITQYKKSMIKHTNTHTYLKWTQKSLLTYIIRKLTGEADNKQLSPKRGGDRRLRKQTWVMSSKLNGKPCVRKTGESIHIYGCQDFNINIIESTSDVFLSTDWFTHKLPSLFDENENTTKRLIYRQTPLNKQLIMLGY